MELFVSVILPNYNHARFLRQRIDSILSQSYQNFELIILDDKSTDNSIDVINQYSNNDKISHIIINENNSGSTFLQWHKGFELAKGDLIWIAESDDYCTADFLHSMIDAFSNNNKISFAYCTSYIVNETGALLKRKDIAEKIPGGFFYGYRFLMNYMLAGNGVWNASAVVFRKEFALKADKRYMNFKAAGDHLFWIELAEMGDIIHISEKKNFFRQHNDKVTPTKFKDGTLFREEHIIYSYIKNKYHISSFLDLKSRSAYLLRILKGEFLTDGIKSDLLRLWGYKNWMSILLLRIIIRIK